MSFKIATAQYPLTAHEDFFAWEKHIESWVQEAVANKAQLLVFPEYGSMELVSVMAEQIQKDLILQVKEMSHLQEKFLATFKALAKKYSCSILTPSLPVHDDNGKIINRAFFIGSGGGVAYQDKYHMTRFEDEWGVQSGEPSLQIFETQFGDIGVSICFDVEFPTAANKLAKEGVKILLAPSCTETLAGCNRVHIGARARALENQYYVVVSQTVGNASWSQAIDINTGFAAVYGPPDVGFPEDGVVVCGELNKPGWVYAEIDFNKVDYVREHGQVLNFKHTVV